MPGFAQEMSLVDLERWAAQTGANLAGASLQTPLKQCAVLLKADMLENFAEGHGPHGEAWAPLAHPRPTGGSVPLRDNGILAASVSAAGEGHVESISETDLILGTNLEYAALQQYGGTIEPKTAKMLAIPLTPEAKRAGRPRRFPGTLHAVVNAGKEADSDQHGGSMGPKKATKGVLLDEDDTAQYALTVGPIKVPARPFAGFSEKATQGIQRIFLEFLGGLVK